MLSPTFSFACYTLLIITPLCTSSLPYFSTYYYQLLHLFLTKVYHSLNSNFLLHLFLYYFSILRNQGTTMSSCVFFIHCLLQPSLPTRLHQRLQKAPKFNHSNPPTIPPRVFFMPVLYQHYSPHPTPIVYTYYLYIFSNLLHA